MKSFLKQSFGLFALIVSLGISVYLHKKTEMLDIVVGWHADDTRCRSEESIRQYLKQEISIPQCSHIHNEYLATLLTELCSEDVDPYDPMIRQELDELAVCVGAEISPFQSNNYVFTSIFYDLVPCWQFKSESILKLIIRDVKVVAKDSIWIKIALFYDDKGYKHLEIFENDHVLSQVDLMNHEGDVEILTAKITNPVTGGVQVFKGEKYE